MRNLLILLGTVSVLASCNLNYDRSESGIIYKITGAKKKDDPLKVGSMVKYHISFSFPERDTVLYSTYSNVPQYATIDSSVLGRYNWLELLIGRHPGNVIEFSYSIDSLAKRNMQNGYDKVFGRRDMVKGKITILQSFTSPEDMQNDQIAEVKSQQERERNQLKNWILRKNIKATESPLGMYVQVQEKGNGPAVDTGMTVLVNYTGRFLKDGKVFDSNTDPKFNRLGAIPVTIGKGGILPGFEAGLRYFNKGGKGKLYLPSFLAYGAQGSLPTIPPYASLIFDVEITDIVPAAPPQQDRRSPVNDDGHGH